MTFRLPPEWYPQDAVMLTWPHADTDWAPFLSEVIPVYLEIAREVLSRQALVLVCHNQTVQARVRELFENSQIDQSSLYTVVIPCNDTWARDHGPITLINENGESKAMDFTFNGWGGKYEASLDNAINAHLLKATFTSAQHQVCSMVLEGGGIEVDEKGNLLTTEQCLLNPNRNPNLSREQIESELKDTLGVNHILWIKHGELDGDDTDSHIDTLARFAPNNTIAYVQCSNPNDDHYPELHKMERELQALTNQQGESFNLVPLPWPDPCFNAEGERLPATYANFLVINGAVLLPIYRQAENDQTAINQIQKAFPDHEIIAIDCLPLIQQFGSLHCISMQLPKGFLA